MIEETVLRPFSRSWRFARTVLVAAACTLAAVHPIDAQQRVTATSGDPGVIARIRAQFAEIEREAPTYRRTTHELQGFSLEGGKLVGFYRGSELRKLAAHHYGESGEATEEYYFSNGRPVFIYVVDSRYDELLSGRVRYRTEDRYYFDGGRLVRRVHTPDPARDDEEDPPMPDPDLPDLLKTAERFAACAAATGSEPRECTAPDQ
jgi:hypothetical protein